MSEVMKLPKIQDLVSDVGEAFKNDQFKLLVNQEPPKQWLKVNKFANNSVYVPIDKVEYLLDKIIQHWKVEILETKPLFNSVMVTVRLHYKHPIDGSWYFHDGVACKELQTKKDSGVLKPDFSNINSGALEIAAPIAKTMAIKDACDHIGKIFGRDLNRKDTMEFMASYEKPTIKNKQIESEKQSLIYFINIAKSLEMLENLEVEIDKSDDDLVLIFESKKKELLNEQLKNQEHGNAKK